MSAWRLDEVRAEEDGGLVADLDVSPGDPHTHRRIERMERQVTEKPGMWQNRIGLAQALVQDGQFERASQQLRTSLELVADPQVLAALFFNLGVCEENMERWEQAAAAYEQSAFLMPQLYWAHYGLGVSMHKLGNLAGAIASLRHAVAMDTEIEDGHQALAAAYSDAGLLHEATAECRWLLELDPDTLWAARTLEDLKRKLN